jgi:mRNA interferase RelE/StbE
LAWRVEFAAKAEKQFRLLDRAVQRRLATEIDGLADNPRPYGAVKLAGGEDIYRIRMGDYRVVYQVRDRVLLVLVVRVGHRKDIYRGL